MLFCILLQLYLETKKVQIQRATKELNQQMRSEPKMIYETIIIFS